MNSLVGYGVSSNSESDGDSGDDGLKFTSRLTDELKEGVQKHRNFLLESGSASSESDDELDPEEELRPELPSVSSLVTQPPISSHVPIPSPSFLAPKLPPPPLGASTRSSVFANPFKAQADQKLHALQKHVPLTLQARPSQIAGKRMCVAYRKDGRCRFGIKCKFAHDSDLQSSIIPGDDDPPSVDDAEPDPNRAGQQPLHNQGGDKETEGQQGKKRRVGLSNTLVPPKRAMKNYAMQKERERVNLS
ncbi:uncharacterized protein si:ch211-113e8.11 [Osmerus eperlanus]|uniref:uncharacterized protein si:ch211-113e8.11 n=1 Tax=Osmerus eperlanus TaxID=29151 RepID=UPI002E10C5D2